MHGSQHAGQHRLFRKLPAFVSALIALSACGSGGGGEPPIPNPGAPLELIAGTQQNIAPQPGAQFFIRPPIATDAKANLYGVSDCNILRISPNDAVTQVARISPTGSCDLGNGRFLSVDGIAVDAEGNVYLADELNSVIRKVSATGVSSVLAGAEGIFGTEDGLGTEARFLSTRDLAVDTQAVVHVLDPVNLTVRRISAEGVVTTLRPDLAKLPGGAPNHLGGMAVDAAGSMYTVDFVSQRVIKLSRDGVPSVLAGSGRASSADDTRDGSGDQAAFFDVKALSVNALGTVFVADGHTVRQISPAGVVSTLAGRPGSADSLDGPGDAARFYGVLSLAANPAGGGLAVFDQALGFRRIAPDGSVATLGGRRPFGSTDGPAAQARFFGMRGVAVDALGNVYLADVANGTIRKVSAGGDVSTFAGRAQLSALPLDGVGPAARFMSPSNMVFDASGTLYVVDFRSVRRVSPQAEVRTILALPEGPDLPERACDSAQSAVADLAADASGTLYYTNPEQHVICKITPQGEALLLAGTVGQPGSNDGPGPAARFFRPSHLAVDAEGALYVSDAGNETVRKISPAGDVSTVAGRAGQRGATDGVGSNARFSSPGDLVIAADGSVYVADTRNRAVRRLATDGTVSTFTRAVGPLTPPILGLFSPTALAIGPGGQLYIADEAQDVLWRAQLP